MPEEPLSIPGNAEQAGASELLWMVVARNERVNRDWAELIRDFPGNAAKCYDHLRHTPMLRRQGRIFPMRGKRYAGAWEYELSSGARVFYVPDPELKKVTVYYAGRHPRGDAPAPPKEK